MGDDAKKEDVFFSQRVDEALRDTVRRIQGKHDHFGTDWMAYPGADAEPVSERVEAWKHPATGLWKIDHFTHMPGGASQQETVARQGLCFFDALHYCARWQKTEEEKSRHAVGVAGARWESVPHYRKAAEAAGQAIDEDGEAHPCAFGQVLSDRGWFSEKALADALKTKKEKLGSLPDVNFVDSMVGDLLASRTPAAGDENEWIARSVQKRDVINQFRAVIDAGDAMVNNLSHAVNIEFKSDFQRKHAVTKDFDPDSSKKAFQNSNNSTEDIQRNTKACLKTVLTLGLAPAIGYATGNQRYSVNRSFMRLRNEFQRAAEGLPDCAEKTTALEFAKATEFAFWMERAAVIYNDCQERQRKPEDTREGVPFVEKAAAAMSLGSLEANGLKGEYLAGSVQCEVFKNKIRDKWKDKQGGYDYKTSDYTKTSGLRGKLEEKITALEGQQNPQPRISDSPRPVRGRRPLV
jgi:hypothetical protein